MTCTCCTRNSCGHWMNDNTIAFHAREKIKDCIVNSNGGVKCEEWCLKEDMTHHRIRTERSLHEIVPPNEMIDNDAHKKRNPGCEWGKNKDKVRKMNWTEVDKWHENPIEFETKIVEVPEFVNRCGCVSSCAHATNCLNAVHQLTRTQMTQLIHAALLTPSQMQFCHTASLMEKEQFGKWEDKNMFKEFHLVGEKLGVKWGGGPLPRFQGQPDKKNNEHVELFQFCENDVLQQNIKQLEKAMDDLEDGNWLNEKRELTKSLASHKIMNLGNVGSLSFPSLCCFTGLCTTMNAMTTAKFALPNKSHNDHSHLNLMKTWLEKELVEKQINVDTEDVTAEKKIKQLWKAIAKSLNEMPATIENATCAVFRGQKRCDICFEKQSLCNLTDNSDKVLVKTWGSMDWKMLDGRT